MRHIIRLYAATALLLSLVSGCVAPIVLSPRGEIRRISSADLERPVKPEFHLPNIGDFSAIAVDREYLVGKWKMTTESENVLVDRQEMTEERSSRTSTYNYDLKDDGTFALDNGLRGTWSLTGAMLNFHFSGNYYDETYRVCCASHDEMIWVTTQETHERCVEQRRRTVGISGYDTRISGGIDEDGCHRMVYDHPYARSGVLRFTEIVMSSPPILRRIGGRSTQKPDPLAVERRKNLDSLLKAGVITEEEYKEEMEKMK